MTPSTGIPAVSRFSVPKHNCHSSVCGHNARAASRPKKTCFTPRFRSRRDFLTLAASVYPLLSGFFHRGSKENSISHTNKFFSFCYFSITYPFARHLEPGGGTTVESVGLPQFGAILTVKMPTDPIIIIIPGSWI